MNLQEYLKRPVTPPESDSIRMTFKRAIEAGKPVRQERFNYYYWFGWFRKLGNKWGTHDIYLHLILNLARKDREYQGKDQDPVTLRDAAKTLRTMAKLAQDAADVLDGRAERFEGQDAETEAAD